VPREPFDHQLLENGNLRLPLVTNRAASLKCGAVMDHLTIVIIDVVTLLSPKRATLLVTWSGTSTGLDV
jgi:hypothetical protein